MALGSLAETTSALDALLGGGVDVLHLRVGGGLVSGPTSSKVPPNSLTAASPPASLVSK